MQSLRGYSALTSEQKGILNRNYKMVVTNVDTIEHVGGGSCRCMLAEDWSLMTSESTRPSLINFTPIKKTFKSVLDFSTWLISTAKTNAESRDQRSSNSVGEKFSNSESDFVSDSSSDSHSFHSFPDEEELGPYESSFENLNSEIPSAVKERGII